MREYIMTLIGAVLVCSLGAMLAPEGEGSAGGYVKLLGGLCVLCVAISPLSSLVGALGDIGENGTEIIFGDMAGEGAESGYGEIYGEQLLEAGGANMAGGLSVMLCRDLGLDADTFDVYVELYEGDEELLPRRVTVVLYGKALFADPHGITDYVTALLGCGCEIVYM